MNVFIVFYADYSSGDEPEVIGVASSIEAAKKIARKWCADDSECFDDIGKFEIFETIEEAKEKVIDTKTQVFIWNEEESMYELNFIDEDYIDGEISIKSFEVKE